MLDRVIFGVVEALYLAQGGRGCIPHDIAIKACFSFVYRVVRLILDHHSCPHSIFSDNPLFSCSGPSGSILMDYSFITLFASFLLIYMIMAF